MPRFRALAYAAIKCAAWTTATSAFFSAMSSLIGSLVLSAAGYAGYASGEFMLEGALGGMVLGFGTGAMVGLATMYADVEDDTLHALMYNAGVVPSVLAAGPTGYAMLPTHSTVATSALHAFAATALGAVLLGAACVILAVIVGWVLGHVLLALEARTLTSSNSDDSAAASATPTARAAPAAT